MSFQEWEMGRPCGIWDPKICCKTFYTEYGRVPSRELHSKRNSICEVWTLVTPVSELCKKVALQDVYLSCLYCSDNSTDNLSVRDWGVVWKIVYYAQLSVSQPDNLITNVCQPSEHCSLPTIVLLEQLRASALAESLAT